ncbi:hypothetical protein BB559_003382 [Furculomyces boomerangus]|uniref:Uncharacterized protein n=2 Tax=Harpellales TaxID=61421 RepID=A0A2T9YLJ8_9FUNG|nr:hypothetical protein BB559_003382 [Furculomyces boomerangus]PVZ99230.1 hypothetical protein BB558_004755 [Smittium angustum]
MTGISVATTKASVNHLLDDSKPKPGQMIYNDAFGPLSNHGENTDLFESSSCFKKSQEKINLPPVVNTDSNISKSASNQAINKTNAKMIQEKTTESSEKRRVNKNITVGTIKFIKFKNKYLSVETSSKMSEISKISKNKYILLSQGTTEQAQNKINLNINQVKEDQEGMVVDDEGSPPDPQMQ